MKKAKPQLQCITPGCTAMRKSNPNYCIKCMNRESQRKTRANKRIAQVCSVCGGPRDCELLMCARCRSKQHTERKLNKLQGNCSRCTKPLTKADRGKFAVCAKCRFERKIHRQAQK